VTLLAQKHRAAESALVLSDGRIPDVLRDLFERYGQADPGTATKRWTKVLALLADAPVAELAQVVTHALARGTTIRLRSRSCRAKACASASGGFACVAAARIGSMRDYRTQFESIRYGTGSRPQRWCMSPPLPSAGVPSGADHGGEARHLIQDRASVSTPAAAHRRGRADAMH
jgi:ferric-dicitrate binding protein FerR (iron transport regulator)